MLCLITSFIFHFILGLSLYGPPPSSFLKSKEPITVELLDGLKKMPVRQVETPDDLLSNHLKTPSLYSSKHKQRVKKQSQSLRSGKTVNRSFEPIIRRKTKTRSQNVKAHKKISSQPNQEGTLTNKPAPFFPQILPQFKNVGLSTLGEKLSPSIKVGSFTALNTDRHLYYSFYMRIEDQIRHLWEKGVQRSLVTLKRYPYQVRDKNKKQWKTDIWITLSKKGLVKKVLIKKSSGSTLLDEAAARSFRQSKIFPNPPKDLISENGDVDLQYRFYVHWNPTKNIF